VRVFKGIRNATDEQITGMREAVSKLRDYQLFLAGDLITALCVLDEAAAKEQAGRPADPSLRRDAGQSAGSPPPTRSLANGQLGSNARETRQ
jgi:hypothetical protein